MPVASLMRLYAGQLCEPVKPSRPHDSPTQRVISRRAFGLLDDLNDLLAGQVFVREVLSRCAPCGPFSLFLFAREQLECRISLAYRATGNL